jgi:hypothetical protein
MDWTPVAGGGYGDVHKGRFKGQQIAVKILRIGRDNDRLLKVGSVYGWIHLN